MKCRSFLIALATLFITITGIAQTKTVTDVDGNVYHTVTIGTQTWMVENLRTTRYNDSTDIPNVTDEKAWYALTTAGYCWYKNDVATYKDTYGALYNWYTVNTGKLAPKGWHVPTDGEWTTLENYLIANGYNYDGTTTGNRSTNNKIAKALASATGWVYYNKTGVPGNTDYPAKRNATGFTALPSGFRSNTGLFNGFGAYATWWSSSDSSATLAWSRGINNYSYVVRYHDIKKIGFSVRCVLSQDQITITYPTKGETILADSKYNIEWNSSGIDSIKIDYSLDNGKTFHKITSGIPAAADSFTWHVPDTLASKCKLVITNLDDPSDTTVLSNFRIKGYVLTRFKANGDFEAYDPAVHGWQFKNDGDMWPETWWEGFNYYGIDPITGLSYPAVFRVIPSLIDAKSYDFPDWQLYTKTFGVDQCYKRMSPPTYSPSALLYWAFIKGTHRGSCFGFAISSLLKFDFPEEFRALFPQIGSYTNLIELPLNDYRRMVINQLHQYQDGLAAISFETTLKQRTPRETLQDAKDNFMSPIRNHRGLTLYGDYTLNGKPGGHEVLPYALKKIPNSSKFELLVYDSNCPKGDCPSYGKPAVLIDSLYNTWDYPPLKWGSGTLNRGLYLDSPANTYLKRPILPGESDTKSATIGEQATIQVMNRNSASITIRDAVGNAIGFAESSGVNTIPNGFPIIPKTGIPEAPIGYVIPSGSYEITLYSFRDSLASVAVFGNSSVFNYWRNDAVNNQTDRLSYDNGMEFRNPDAKTKTVNLEVINRLADCESDFKILNLAVGIGDSVRLKSPDNDRVALVNKGSAKIYDLNIAQACSGLSGVFNYHRITVPAHSTHFIVPDLQDLLNHPVKIYVDKENTGIISDSLIISNQVTGINNQINTGNGGRFSLDQNYPNPFHTTTTIGFHIAEPCHVLLKVFDVMGADVAILLNGQKPAGDYPIEWNAVGLRSGIYFCELQCGGSIEVIKMLLQ